MEVLGFGWVLKSLRFLAWFCQPEARRGSPSSTPRIRLNTPFMTAALNSFAFSVWLCFVNWTVGDRGTPPCAWWRSIAGSATLRRRRQMVALARSTTSRLQFCSHTTLCALLHGLDIGHGEHKMRRVGQRKNKASPSFTCRRSHAGRASGTRVGKYVRTWTGTAGEQSIAGDCCVRADEEMGKRGRALTAAAAPQCDRGR
jgi:hypothetical protein